MKYVYGINSLLITTSLSDLSILKHIVQP